MNGKLIKMDGLDKAVREGYKIEGCVPSVRRYLVEIKDKDNNVKALGQSTNLMTALGNANIDFLTEKSACECSYVMQNFNPYAGIEAWLYSHNKFYAVMENDEIVFTIADWQDRPVAQAKGASFCEAYNKMEDFLSPVQFMSFERLVNDRVLKNKRIDEVIFVS